MQRNVSKENLIASLKETIASMEGGSPEEGRPNPNGARSPSGNQHADATQYDDAQGFQSTYKKHRNNELAKPDVLDDEEKAYQKILRILNYRDRTSFEIRKKLLEGDFTPQVTEDAIDHARGLNLINDERFSRNFIEQYFRSGKGKRAAINELKKKGIPEVDAFTYLEESSYAQEDESSRAFAYLNAHPPRGKNLRESAFRKLVSKGYTVSAASSAARLYCEKQQ